MTDAQSVHRKVARYLEIIFGEPYGDGEIVTDVIAGYAEPGYGSDESVVVLGNWNPKRYLHGDEPPLTLTENLGPRLADALERFGAEIHWLDEWTSCQGCYRALRTRADSYSWQPSYAWIEDEILCTRCLLEMGEDALAPYVNDATKAITWADGSHVATFGYVERDESYASGWYGREDDPAAILAEIQRQTPDADVVFVIDYNAQFETAFSAYVKADPYDDSDLPTGDFD